MINLFVVESLKDWTLQIQGVEVISSTEYLMSYKYRDQTSLRVFNLCRSYSYQSEGFYVSLLATARGHKPTPSVTTILDMKSTSLLKIRSEVLDELIQQSLKDIRSKEFELSIYFGKNLAKKYDDLSHELHKHFHSPLLRARFIYKDKWRLKWVGPIALKDVPYSHLKFIEEFASEYFSKRMRTFIPKRTRFNLAILCNPNEKMPPSNKKGISNFIKAANKLMIATELIGKDDFNRLVEFDALFIRETTHVNHHTYRFAQKAKALGLVVIDDPDSILKCTNKVYISELFAKHRIPSPKTMIIHESNVDEVEKTLGLPCVLKQPDSAFSQGVKKASSKEELKDQLTLLLGESDLIIGQEYIPTDFDWRVGILDGEPLYVCKYYMAKGHWQIYQNVSKDNVENGRASTFLVEQVSPELIKLAVKSARLIGKGLYGLDIKEKDGKFYVIEINDNPSIDGGIEDDLLKTRLYDRIMECFLQRMIKNSEE
ncbi:MAG: RimK family protein [Oligoflexales bacterium]|nr:RimK family protein [Oligoflexales bacterium]